MIKTPTCFLSSRFRPTLYNPERKEFLDCMRSEAFVLIVTDRLVRGFTGYLFWLGKKNCEPQFNAMNAILYQATSVTVEVRHFFSYATLKFWSLRPIPKTNLEKNM